jgi:pimeloyl-ACP methyl ester carboxylesterase
VPQPGCRRGRSAVWPAAGLDRVHLLAHDRGALIGYQPCLRHPRRVQSHLSLSVPPRYLGFDTQLVLTIVRRAWLSLLAPVLLLGPLLMSKGHQRMARSMLPGFTSDRKAFSAQDVEIFAAQLREPARARAGSAPYRHFIQPEAVRVLTGSDSSNQRLWSRLVLSLCCVILALRPGVNQATAADVYRACVPGVRR